MLRIMLKLPPLFWLMSLWLAFIAGLAWAFPNHRPGAMASFESAMSRSGKSGTASAQEKFPLRW